MFNHNIRAKRVPGFRWYFVTETGDVYSVAFDEPKKLACPAANNGYQAFTAVDDATGRREQIYVHQIVAKLFVTRPVGSGRMEVCHKDGNRFNNRADNLRWGYHRDNIYDKAKHGTWQSGEKHPRATINWEMVREIRRRYDSGQGPAEIARALSITHHIAQSVGRRKSWKEVASP